MESGDRILTLKIVELQILHQIRSNTALFSGNFYSQKDHIRKLYENMLIYTEVQNIRLFSVRLLRRIRHAVLIFVHCGTKSVTGPISQQLTKGWKERKAASG